MIGTLPWPVIHEEVIDAICRYLVDEYNGFYGFVSIPRLTEYVYTHPHRNLQPHLYNKEWDVVRARISKTIKDLKWEKFSRNVYMVPVEMRARVERRKVMIKGRRAVV